MRTLAPGDALKPYGCRCFGDLPKSVVDAFAGLPDTAATPLSANARRKEARRTYNHASSLLNKTLNLPDPSWREAGPNQYEDQITTALVAALQPAPQATPSALCLQQVLLGRQPQAVRDFYRNRLMPVVRTPAGQLRPDFVLNGTAYQPPEGLPTCFFGEVKYKARLNVPIASDYYLKPADIDIDTHLLWRPDHQEGGVRAAHPPNAACTDIWHTSVRKGRHTHSAVQLDIYLAYPRRVLNYLDAATPDRSLEGLANHPQVRVSGLFVDAWARYVDADTAYTHERWTTATFAGLLVAAAAHYFGLSQVAPGSSDTAAVGLLAARLLYL